MTTVWLRPQLISMALLGSSTWVYKSVLSSFTYWGENCVKSFRSPNWPSAPHPQAKTSPGSIKSVNLTLFQSNIIPTNAIVCLAPQATLRTRKLVEIKRISYKKRKYLERAWTKVGMLQLLTWRFEIPRRPSEFSPIAKSFSSVRNMTCSSPQAICSGTMSMSSSW